MRTRGKGYTTRINGFTGQVEEARLDKNGIASAAEEYKSSTGTCIQA